MKRLGGGGGPLRGQSGVAARAVHVDEEGRRVVQEKLAHGHELQAEQHDEQDVGVAEEGLQQVCPQAGGGAVAGRPPALGRRGRLARRRAANGEAKVGRRVAKEEEGGHVEGHVDGGADEEDAAPREAHAQQRAQHGAHNDVSDHVAHMQNAHDAALARGRDPERGDAHDARPRPAQADRGQKPRRKERELARNCCHRHRGRRAGQVAEVEVDDSPAHLVGEDPEPQLPWATGGAPNGAALAHCCLSSAAARDGCARRARGAHSSAGHRQPHAPTSSPIAPIANMSDIAPALISSLSWNRIMLTSRWDVVK